METNRLFNNKLRNCMIRYEMTNDDDGANSLLTFINDNNNTRIILTDSDVSEL